jgi:hypothetical protein
VGIMRRRERREIFNGRWSRGNNAKKRAERDIQREMVAWRGRDGCGTEL